MRSSLPEEDFAILLSIPATKPIIDDGMETSDDHSQGTWTTKKDLLKTRCQDFKDCLGYLGKAGLKITTKVNKKWGTSKDILNAIERDLGRPISHGALILALDLIGVQQESIDERKDTYVSISISTRLHENSTQLK